MNQTFYLVLLMIAIGYSTPLLAQQDNNLYEVQPSNRFGLSWNNVTPFGIKGSNYYDGGRCWDVEEVSPSAVLFSVADCGIYLSRTGANPVPLAVSMNWKQNNIHCITKGLNDRNVFAGGSMEEPGRALLVVTDPRQDLLSGWKMINARFLGTATDPGIVYNIAVHQPTRTIALATDRGLFVAVIPSDLSTYNYEFHLVPYTDAAVSAGAVTPAYSVVSVGNHFLVGSDKDNHANLFPIARTSAIQPDTLQNMRLTVARVTDETPADIANYARTFVAIPSSDSRTVYAAVADNSGGFAALFRSSDGGETYRRVETTLRGIGGQGNGSNGALAVSPINPDHIALGWVSGIWVSNDGGRTFTSTERVHADITRIKFNAAGNKMYTTNHGGVVEVSIGDRAFEQLPGVQGFSMNYNHNKNLPGLQSDNLMYGFYGRLSVKEQFTPQQQRRVIIGSGFMDNGVGVHYSGERNWMKVLGGDGTLSNLNHFPLMFLTDGISYGNRLHYKRIPASSIGVRENHHAQAVIIRTHSPNTLNRGDVALRCGYAISQVSFRRFPRELLIGYVAADNVLTGSSEADAVMRTGIYRLMADPGLNEVYADFETFLPLAPGEHLAMDAVFSGFSAFFGTNMGRVFKYPAQGTDGALEVANFRQSPTAYTNAYIQKIEVINPLNDQVAVLVQHRLANRSFIEKAYLKNSGEPVQELFADINGRKFSIAHLKKNNTTYFFLATHEKVYFSRRGTGSVDISTGLPRLIRGSDLQVLHRRDGKKDLYLSTYGWGVFVASLDRVN